MTPPSAANESRASVGTPASAANAPRPVPGGAIVECVVPRCQHFPSALAALEVLLQRKARLIAFGEAHALAGTDGIPSATVRFEQELLPRLAAAGASQLLVELVEPPRNCQRAVEAVASVQAPIVTRQKPENQDRFIQLGTSAKRLGVVPFVLQATCVEFEAVQRAGADGVSALLTMIAEKSEGLLRKMLTHGADKHSAGKHSADKHGAEQWVIAYGGALHNDIDNDGGFAFGDSMMNFTGGQYLAVDLIVPEFIKATPVWQALPWYAEFDITARRRDVTLFQTGANAFTLIFGFSD